MNYCNNVQHEELSNMVFEDHIYKKHKKLFNSHGICDEDVKFIKELIDHKLPMEGESIDDSEPAMEEESENEKLQKPERRFLYEV